MHESDWFYAEVSAAIRAARIQSGLTQQALATSVGLSRTSLTNIEMGNQQPSLYVTWRIAEETGVSLQDLLPAERFGHAPALPDDVPAATRAALLRISGEPVSR